MKNSLSWIPIFTDKIITKLSTIDVGQITNILSEHKLLHPYLGIFSISRKWWYLKIEPNAISRGETIELELVGKNIITQKKIIRVTLHATKVTKRVLHLPWKPLFLKAQLIESKRDYPIVHLKILPTTQNFACLHMQKKLAAGSSINAKRTNNKSGLSNFHSHRNESLDTYYFYELSIGQEIDETIKYEKWIKHIEPSLWSHKVINSRDGHLISIVLPTYRPNISYLRHTIESVLNQTYQQWELCIADDASESEDVKKVIKEYCDKDKRINAVFRDINGHISEATNSALDLANGEYVTFLDHDDTLSPHALNEIVCELQKNPKLDILYSDEDFIDSLGERCNPHFKSDWNPYLLYAHNYITHLCVYRHSLIKQSGGLRKGVEGAQDYDLILRCSSLSKPDKIKHIPKILYHWRMAEGSTASSASEKNYTVKAGRKALTDYFHNKKIEVEVLDGNLPNFYQVNFPITRPRPLVSLIIPTKDKAGILSKCIESISNKTTYDNFEIIIIDNNSIEKETLDYLNSIESIENIFIYKYNKPFNYSAINNFGIRKANGEIIGLLNNDVEVISPNWLTEMVSLAIQPSIGCVGAKLLYKDDTIQHAGIILGLGGYAAHSHRNFPADSLGYFNRLNVRQNLSAVTGACLLVKKEIFNTIGGLDEKLAVAYNDVDFCLKIKSHGLLNIFTPYSMLYHYESKTRGAEDTDEKIQRFDAEKKYLMNKWQHALENDPYYNINLTKSKEDFSISLQY